MIFSQYGKFGKYVLLDRIAVGGMAEVYRGKLTGEKGFEKLIVVKKMLPQIAEDKEKVTHFIDEARLAALLQHENIIHVYDFGETGGSYFIAMEYLFGKDLKSVFDKSSQKDLPISLENSLFIALKICEGLDYAHNLKDLHGKPLNIIHRDINPQNIFLTYDGKIKIIDFGIAKTTTQTTKTQVGIVKGKVAYMSPEQAEAKPIDKRSDIFAVGILLYEMITRKEMYVGNTVEVLTKAINAQYEPPEKLAANLPSKVYEILNRALSKDLEKRYQSCGEMAEDIEDCLNKLSYRPNTKMLAKYMTYLFEKECTDEKTKFIKIMENIPEEKHINSKIPVLDQNYQNTEFISKELDGKGVDKKKKKFVTLKRFFGCSKKQAVITSAINGKGNDKKKEIFVILKRFFWCSKKRIALTSTLIILMTIGLIFMKIQDTAKVKQLLSKAEECLIAYKLEDPKEDCALYYYSEVLKLDFGNREAKQGIEEIPDHYALLAKKQMNTFRYEKARQSIEKGLAMSPNHPELLSLKKDVNEKLPKRVLKSFEGLFN